MPSDRGISQILSGCLSGDHKAWGHLIDRSSRLVYWAIWRAIEKHPIPEKDDFCKEVFQDFFTKISEPSELQRLTQVENFESYLCVMASHLVFDRFRKERRTNKMGDVLSVEGDSSEEGSQDPANFLILSEQSRVLGEILDQLSPKERACLELHYSEGKTHREIGIILGIPQDTVSTHLKRAKERSKKRLTERGFER